MKDIERGQKPEEKKAEQPAGDLRHRLDSVQEAASARQEQAVELIHAARRNHPDLNGGLDGATQDLETADRKLHLALVEALGETASKVDPTKAEELTEAARRLLDIQERFADAA